LASGFKKLKSKSNQISLDWIDFLKFDFTLIDLVVSDFSFEPVSWVCSSYQNTFIEFITRNIYMAYLILAQDRVTLNLPMSLLCCSLLQLRKNLYIISFPERSFELLHCQIHYYRYPTITPPKLLLKRRSRELEDDATYKSMCRLESWFPGTSKPLRNFLKAC